eukprot:5631875-Karenia_brevis.AAC.1
MHISESPLLDRVAYDRDVFAVVETWLSDALEQFHAQLSAHPTPDNHDGNGNSDGGYDDKNDTANDL